MVRRDYWMRFRIEIKETRIGNCYIDADSKDIAIQQLYLHLEEFTEDIEWYDSEITVNEVVEAEEEDYQVEEEE